MYPSDMEPTRTLGVIRAAGGAIARVVARTIAVLGSERFRRMMVGIASVIIASILEARETEDRERPQDDSGADGDPSAGPSSGPSSGGTTGNNSNPRGKEGNSDDNGNNPFEST